MSNGSAAKRNTLTTPEWIVMSALWGREPVKCSKIVYRLCNHMVYSFDILKASQKKRKRWRWLGRKGLWK